MLKGVWARMGEHPIDWILTAGLLAMAGLSVSRGTRMFALGLRSPGHPAQSYRVVKGIRGWISGLACISMAGGIHFHAGWPVILGLVFLGEELLETGIMILALRRSGQGD